MMSNKNRICNCVSDESSQKNYARGQQEESRRNGNRYHVNGGSLSSFSYFWSFHSYHCIVCTITNNLQMKNGKAENMSPWGGPMAVP